MKQIFVKFSMFLIAFYWPITYSYGQTAPTPQTLPYSQDFSGLAHSSTTYPAGWQGWGLCSSGGCSTSVFRTNAPIENRSLLANSSASTTTGGVHNYNGKIGILLSLSVDPTICLAINTTGYYNVVISFDAMTIRNPYDGTTNTRINGFDLQYRVGDISGSWTSVTGLPNGFYQNNTTTQTGSGVTTPQNLQSFSFQLPAACNNQSAVYLRWVTRDISGSGSRPSFAIDNISVCPSNPTPSVSIAITSGSNPMCQSLPVTFQATVTHGGSSPSFQWILNGVNVGTNSNTYTLNNPSDGDQIICQMTSSAACVSALTVNSNTITLMVSSPMNISGNVTNVSCFGQSDGAVNPIINGGVSPYTCAWTGPTFMVMDVMKDPSHPYYGVGSAMGYEIDGVQGKELTLVRGITYTFNINAPGHPFYISTDPNGAGAGEVTQGVTGSQTDVGILTFTPDNSHPSLLYYQCFSHLNMGWKLNIVNGITGCDASNLMPGNYSVTVTDAYGCQAVESFTVTEPSLLQISSSANTPLCTGSDLYLESTPSGGTTPYLYAWAGPNAFSSSVEDPVILGVTTNHSGLFTVQVTDNNGCTATANVSVMVEINITSAPVFTLFPSKACVNDTTQWSINPVTHATSYDWYATNQTAYVIPPGNGTSVSFVHLPTSFSGYEINVRGMNSCGYGPVSKKWIRRTVSVPMLNGPNYACPNDTKTYTIPTAVAGAVSYTFTAPTGSVISDGINSGNPLTTTALSVNVTFPTGFTSGSVCVAAMGPCEMTAQRCITVRSTPVISTAIVGNASVCPPVSSTTYSIPPVAGATGYQWTLPSGFSVIQYSNDYTSVEVAIASNFSSGNICVAATYGCGYGTPRCLMVKSQVPATPGSMTGPVAGVCNGLFTYSVPLVSGVTYNWTATNGALVTPSNNTATVDFSTVSSFPVNVCVTASNSCGTSSPRCLNNIRGVPATPGPITGPDNVCMNATGISYSIAPIFGALSYRWTAPAGSIISDGSASGNPLITNANAVTINFGISGGNVSVRAQNSCGLGGTRNKTITVVDCNLPPRYVLNNDQLKLQPNPAAGSVTLEYNADNQTTATIELLDVSGRKLFSNITSFQAGTNVLTFDFSQYAAGTYIVSVISEKQHNYVRLILEK